MGPQCLARSMNAVATPDVLSIRRLTRATRANAGVGNPVSWIRHGRFRGSRAIHGGPRVQAGRWGYAHHTSHVRAPAPPDCNSWTQHWSEEHLKPFYHNPETGESVWEKPADGTPVQMMSNIEELQQSARLASHPAPKPMTVLISVILPVGLVLLGLFIMAQFVPEMREMRRKQRNRAQQRKKEKASRYRMKWKMSQDGKGGRSANA